MLLLFFEIWKLLGVRDILLIFELYGSTVLSTCIWRIAITIWIVRGSYIRLRFGCRLLILLLIVDLDLGGVVLLCNGLDISITCSRSGFLRTICSDKTLDLFSLLRCTVIALQPENASARLQSFAIVLSSSFLGIALTLGLMDPTDRRCSLLGYLHIDGRTEARVLELIIVSDLSAPALEARLVGVRLAWRLVKVIGDSRDSCLLDEAVLPERVALVIVP